jgi:hypothetical protein
MAHWSELDENNLVTRVTVGNNEDSDEGYQWLLDNLGGRWIKTSYNTRGGIHTLGGTPLRMNFGDVGYTYDEELDAFIPPKEYESWVLNEETCLWEAPVPCPEDGNYFWSENELNWILVSDPV